jgi:hypothetical protein
MYIKINDFYATRDTHKPLPFMFYFSSGPPEVCLDSTRLTLTYNLQPP